MLLCSCAEQKKPSRKLGFFNARGLLT